MMRRFFSILLLTFSIHCHGQHISTEELRPLNFLVGEWKVDVNVRLSKQGPWEKSEARSTIHKIVGETIFEEEYVGTKQGHSLSGKMWLGNDNRTKLYQKVFVDSDHGVLILFEGRLEGKLLTLQTELTLNDVHLLLRSQYTLTSNDSFIVESSRSMDESKHGIKPVR